MLIALYRRSLHRSTRGRKIEFSEKFVSLAIIPNVGNVGIGRGVGSGSDRDRIGQKYPLFTLVSLK